MQDRVGSRGQKNGGRGRPARVRTAAALVGLVLLGGGLTCGVREPDRSEEPVGQSADAIFNGQADTAGNFRAVGALLTPIGQCSTFLIAPRVALTAAHCVPSRARGCQTHTYQQPAMPGAAPAATNLRVRFPAPGSNEDQLYNPGACVAAGTCQQYSVDSFAWLPDTYPVNAYDCCEDDPNLCFACGFPDGQFPKGLPMLDIAVLHLDRDVVGVEPMQTLLRHDLQTNEAPDPARGAFKVNPLGWVGAVVHVAGSGTVDDSVGQGLRRWGPTTLSSLNLDDEPEGSNEFPAACDEQTAKYYCEDCNLTLDPTGISGGGADTRRGDSGSPLVMNYTALSATPIAGLPADVPVAVAIQDAVLWDTDVVVTSSDGSTMPIRTQVGSFILARLTDWDGDGVNDELDNCLVAYNPNQENCNEAAENARGYEPVGDACDPIPCASAEVQVREEVVLEIDETFLSVMQGRRIADRLDVEPHGSSSVGNGAHPTRPVPEVSVPTVPTHYRFCQEEPLFDIDCLESSIDDSFLNVQPPEGGPPTSTAPYLPARTRVGLDLPTTSETMDHDFGQTSDSRRRRWHYEDDAQSWLSHGWITDLSGCSPVFGCGTGLDGRFWIKSETVAGTLVMPMTSPVVAGGNTGYRIRLDGTASGLGLANHYVFLRPDASFSIARVITVPSIWFKWMLWIDPGDPYRDDGYDGSLWESSVLVSAEGGHYAVLRRDGTAALVDDRLGADLRARLDSGDEVWRSAAEPRLLTGSAPMKSGFHALAFAADGTDVVEGVLRQGLNIGTTVDMTGTAPGRPGSPSSREGFQAVFSRSEDAAFVIGGRDTSTGEELGDVWMRSVVGPGEWTDVPLRGGFSLGKVLAATFSYGDRKLWVLDEHAGPPGFALDGEGGLTLCHQNGRGAGKSLHMPLPAANAHLEHGDSPGLCAADVDGKTFTRLLRIDPYTGAVEPVGFWPTGGGASPQLWLVVDQDGGVLLASSSSQHYSVARFSVDPYRLVGAVTLESIAQRPGRLAGEPIVDARGYGFVLEKAGRLELVRADSLGGAPAALSAVGSLL